VADSTGTAGSDGASVALAVLYRTGTGNTIGANRGSWTIRLRVYGYDPVEYTVNEADYSLGTAGTAKNVSFGGAQNQIARTTLPAQATADAYTGVSIADGGATPTSWNSKPWGITITGNLTTNPSLTDAQVLAHVTSQISKSATWGGKAGYLWHVVVDENPSGAGYVSLRGLYGVSTLGATCTSGDTTLTVGSTTSMPTAGNFRLESEEISYTGKTGTTLTGCTRGVNSTTAAAHTYSSAAPLPIMLYKGVRVVDQAGNPFPGFVGMVADDGTTYVPPELIAGVVSGFAPNSRIVVYNETTDTVVYDAQAASSPLTLNYVEGTDFSDGDTISVYHVWYNSVDGSTATQKGRVAAVAGPTGWSALIEQEACTTYAAYYATFSTTGSAVYATGEFARDGTNLQVDIDDPDNNWFAHRMFMWDKYDLWFNSGRIDFFLEISASDAGNLSIGSLLLDNLSANTARQGDEINVVNATSTLPVVNPTTGGGGLTMYSGGKILTTSSSGVAPSEAQIKSWVRAELATEMARIDVATSTRLAAASYTAPDNATLSTVATKTDELHRIHGLKSGEPMTVTPTTRAAGSISQVISGDGSTTTTVTRS
jgi:hypothetical protein